MAKLLGSLHSLLGCHVSTCPYLQLLRSCLTQYRVMTHSDDKGLVLPPRVAETQVIIIPVGLTAKYVLPESIAFDLFSNAPS